VSFGIVSRLKPPDTKTGKAVEKTGDLLFFLWKKDGKLYS
jgi:hypothetical protein